MYNQVWIENDKIRSMYRYTSRSYPILPLTIAEHTFSFNNCRRSRPPLVFSLNRTCSQSKPEQSGAQPSKNSIEQFLHNSQEIVHNRDERCNQCAQRRDQWAKEGESGS